MRRVLGGRRSVRVLAACAVLFLTCAACQIDVQLETTVNGDGSGTFSLRFVIDKELVDLARNTGQDPFAALSCPDELKESGWTCGRSTQGGGLQISLDRSFRSHDEFNDAMAELERLAAEQDGPTAQFFTLHISRESGFFTSRTAVEGSVDLTATGVLGEASEESRATLESIITQAAGEFFTFVLTVKLPGKISSSTGDPDRIEGGTAIWRPRLGRSLSFRAESSAYNVGSVAVIGGPALGLLVVLAVTFVRRGRRRPVEPPPAVAA